MYRSRTVYLCHFFFPVSEECEEFVCIRPASGHSDETGVQLPVGFLRLARAFRRGSVLVYAVLGEKVRTDMQYVVDGIRRGRNPSQILQFPIQLFQVEIRQTDIPDAFRCLSAFLHRRLSNATPSSYAGSGPERCSLSSLS